MEELLTLRNYTNLLDPDDIDTATAIHRKDGVKLLSNKADGLHSATISASGADYNCSLVMGDGDEIKSYTCNCEAFHGGKMPDEPCVHLLSLIIAINNGDMPANGKPAKKTLTKATTKKAATKPIKVVAIKLPKDPALNMLHQLSASEIFGYLEKALKENKDIKNHFLIHFSNKLELSKESIIKIIDDARKSVIGRRQYMNVPESNKISKLIKPLFEQAVEAEASGAYLQSFSIAAILFEQLYLLTQSIQSENNGINKLGKSCAQLLNQIATNKTVPSAVSDKLYDFAVIKAFDYNQYIYWWYFELMDIAEKIALKQGTLPILAQKMNEQIKEIAETHNRGAYTTYSTVIQGYILKFIELLQKHDLYNKKQLESLYKEYKRFPEVYFILINYYIKEGEIAIAREHMAGMKKLFSNNNHLSIRNLNLILSNLEFSILYHSNDRTELIKYLASLIKTDFETASVALINYKEIIDNTKTWDEIVIEIANITRINSEKLPRPHLSFLQMEKQYEQLMEQLILINDPILCYEYSDSLINWDVDKFMHLINTHLLSMLTSFKSSNYMHRYIMRNFYALIHNNLPGGKELMQKIYAKRHIILYPPDDVYKG